MNIFTESSKQYALCDDARGLFEQKMWWSKIGIIRTAYCLIEN